MKLNTYISFTIKATALLLVFILLTPSAVKFTHAFNHHEHDVCEGKSDTHFHTVDVECDFYKFKLNTTYYNEVADVQQEELLISRLTETEHYFFLYNHQQLTSYLRGPPGLI